MTARWYWCLFLSGVACGRDWDRFEPPSPTGPVGRFELTFQEECRGTSVDPRKWNTAFVAPNRTSTFRRYDWNDAWVADSNATLADDLCVITVENKPSGDGEFTSGTFDSTNKFEQTFGYFEIRLRAARGLGLKTHVDLASGDGWPPQVAWASVSGAATTEQQITVYFRDAEGQTAARSETVPGPDLAAAFHIFGFEWRADAFRFFRDGVMIAERSDSAPFIKGPLRFQITAHVGGDHLPAPDATTFPARIEIDWVRAYRHLPD